MHKASLGSLLAVAAATVAAACGGDDKTCDIEAVDTGCGNGLVCEAVVGGDPRCFKPVLVKGRVFDLDDDVGIGNARVVALDVNGAAISSVALTASDGTYSLPVPSKRDADGVPVALELTLRADAAGYQTFPSGLRPSLAVNTASAVVQDDGRVVKSTVTDIGLIALPVATGLGTIRGKVELPLSLTGVIVVAETSTGPGSANGYVGVASRDGKYAIFNVPAGDASVVAYAQGVNYVPATAAVTAGSETTVDLVLSSEATGSVSGTIQIVNPGSGKATSVILAVESTFDTALERGVTVPGLRDPEPGLAPDVTGAYLIEGVPVGRYVVLAAFENDGLVRDPDLSIGGTSTLHIEVAAGTQTVVDGFKVTGALEVLSPGAGDQPEPVSGTPTFTWVDDSSEASYDIILFDAFGTEVWTKTIPGTSGTNPEVVYDGQALEPGMYYQFRATSISNGGASLSRTEDLRGIFFAE
jgi:hypothetical protein